MNLFYNSNITETTKQIVFSKEESRHIIKALRKKEDDFLHITNGKELYFKAKISIADHKKCIADIIEVCHKPKEWSYYIHIAIAPTKNIDRFEWFLEKATEIGVDEITPILCQNSERKIVKQERLEKIVQSAMKQSLKYKLPILNPLIKVSEFLKQDLTGDKFIAHCEKSEKQSLKQVIKQNSTITLLIGPEGDFSLEEIKTAVNQNFQAVSLGKSRLRTETAGIVAAQSISFIHQ